MHIYFGHTGVHLLPFIQEWDKPCVVSFHGMDIQPRPQQEGYDAQMQELLQTVPLVLARSDSFAGALGGARLPAREIRSIAPAFHSGFALLPHEPPVTRMAGRVFVQACRLIEKKGLADDARSGSRISRRSSQIEVHHRG